MAFYLVALLFCCCLLSLSEASPMASPNLMPNRLKRQGFGSFGGSQGGGGQNMGQGGGGRMGQGGGMNQGGGMGQGGGGGFPFG
ncbi:unnamed protein product [Heligmosomoides polygyrus]|uniref:DUF148 domain-containing protein n=1 Tax=Heligmosomoides polygyrus TaxID=6339 RepID=A0A183GA53_HELPZ|nr:unnamed protein product [Heligmosomoides polygyrus]